VPNNDRGASAVEYGLMVSAIAAVIVLAVFGLGTATRDLFSSTTACLAAGSSSTC
jgi:pilus assembly protein Flp/PilA